MMFEMTADQVLDYARLQEAEAWLKAYVVGLERNAVGGGVLCGDVPTHYIRGAFDWPSLPEKLDADPLDVWS